MAVSVVLTGLLRWEAHPKLSPDGEMGYWADRPPRPYAGRWLLPWLLPREFWIWDVVAIGATFATAVILGALGGWLPAALWLGLASTRTNLWLPVLTDHVGILLLTVAWVTPWPWNVAVALVGGCINEKVPVFAALATGDPRLVLGLCGHALGALRARPVGPDDPHWLWDPVGAARSRGADLFDLRQTLLPWGVASVGLCTTPPAATIVAYGQLLIAQDRARLYQWIGPIVCVHAASWIAPLPVWAQISLVVVHWSHPWRKVI